MVKKATILFCIDAEIIYPHQKWVHGTRIINSDFGVRRLNLWVYLVKKFGKLISNYLLKLNLHVYNLYQWGVHGTLIISNDFEVIRSNDMQTDWVIPFHTQINTRLLIGFGVPRISQDRIMVSIFYVLLYFTHR